MRGARVGAEYTKEKQTHRDTQWGHSLAGMGEEEPGTFTGIASFRQQLVTHQKAMKLI